MNTISSSELTAEHIGKVISVTYTDTVTESVYSGRLAYVRQSSGVSTNIIFEGAPDDKLFLVGDVPVEVQA